MIIYLSHPKPKSILDDQKVIFTSNMGQTGDLGAILFDEMASFGWVELIEIL